jgi:hypothetical protein
VSAVETFVTVLVLLAMGALGVFLIHRLNSQHDERISGFPYGRSLPTVRGPAPSTPRKVRGRTDPRTVGTGDRRDHRDGGRGRLRPRRPTRT